MSALTFGVCLHPGWFTFLLYQVTESKESN